MWHNHLNMIMRVQPSPLFSEAVVHGTTAYISGQVAIDAAGGSFEDQLDEVLRRVDQLLDECGARRSTMLSALVHIDSPGHLSSLNEIWAKWLPDGEAPTRTTVVSALTSPDFAVEITVTAALSGEGRA